MDLKNNHSQPCQDALEGEIKIPCSHNNIKNAGDCSTIFPLVRIAFNITFPPALPYLIALIPTFSPAFLNCARTENAVALSRNKNE